jgi:predicted nucleic acid-binding protein
VAALILDSSVLIGLLDTADAHHHQTVERVDAPTPLEPRS